MIYRYGAGGGGAVNPLPLAPQSNPATPGSGINWTSNLVASDALPAWRDYAGQLWYAQQALWNLDYGMLHGSFGASVMKSGLDFTSSIDSATLNSNAFANTNRYTRNPSAISTIAAAAVNRGCGFFNGSGTGSQNRFWRGDAAGRGGFFFYCRFGASSWTANGRMFVGVASNSSSAAWYTAEPSAQASHFIGLGFDSTDTNVSLFTNNNTTTTKTAIASIPALAGAGAFFLDFWLYAKPNDTKIFYRVDDLRANSDAGQTLADSQVTTTIPSNTVGMGPIVCMGSGSNAAATTAIAATRMMVFAQGGA
jgi:hypothetical protein